MSSPRPERPLSRYEWPPLPITDLDEAAQLLGDALQAAYDDLEAERVRVLTSLTMGRKALVDQTLREFQAEIARFRAQGDFHLERFLTLHLGPRYEEGVVAATGGPMSWTQMHTTAFTSLAVDTYDDFLARAREAERVSEAFVRAVRQAARDVLPVLAAGGRTALQAADRLEERLLTRYGITTVTYRDGTRVTARHYARMAALTKSAVAYNAGTLNGAYAAGVEFVEVFDGADCGWTSHLDLDKANGTVRHVTDAAAYPISHPRCTRGFGPRPDVTTKNQAARAKPSTTAEQRADQRANVDYIADQPPRPRDRATQLRRARVTAQRQARQLGATGPEQVGAIIARILAERGLTT